jgi:protein phosphatase
MVGLQLISAGLTDRGQQRRVNEDTILNHTGMTETGENFGLYIVCDGLGGHEAGDVASRIAVRTVSNALQSILPPLPAHHMSSADINHVLWAAVRKANTEIWNQGKNNGHQNIHGMGTTLTMAVVINETAYTAHVGDSRIYLLRQGKLEQLTQDHTMAAALAEAGHISEEELVDHPRQNILTKALGRQERTEVDLMELQLMPRDILLLCSDGFWKAFKRREILEKRLADGGKTAELCQELVDEANELDGSDNISLIIVAAYEQNVVRRKEGLSRRRVEHIRQPVPA